MLTKSNARSPNEAFGIDGEPPLGSKVQDIAVVNVAVKNDDIPRFGK